jgi:trehalose 6-phosphate synthase/phosphatase
MSPEEATSRWEDLHSHVNTQSAQTFVTSFLTRCIRANSEHQRADLESVSQLDVGRLIPRYRHSSKRLVVVDLEGTLWERDLTHAGLKAPFVPDEETVGLLKTLTEDGRNQVWLLSGLPVKGMMEKFTEAIPALGAM